MRRFADMVRRGQRSVKFLMVGPCSIREVIIIEEYEEGKEKFERSRKEGEMANATGLGPFREFSTVFFFRLIAHSHTWNSRETKTE